MSAGTRPVIATLGAGRMGRGIAHVFAYAGHPVRLLDCKPRAGSAFTELAAAARAEIDADLHALAAAGLFDAAMVPAILARIGICPRDAAATALADAVWVFECVPEVLERKRETLAWAEPLLADDAVLASTTSSFLVDTLAAMLCRPQRFLNAHWLNPAYLIPLVELSPGNATDSGAVDGLYALLEGIGKVPVRCRPSPGYIVPRIQALAMNEAARLVEQGVASAEDIDRAIRYGFGFRFAALGLLEFIDWGGGDILYYASRYLREALGEEDRPAERFAPPRLIRENMDAGRLGIGNGEGFYDYRGRDLEAYRAEVLQRFVALLRHYGAARPPAPEP